MVQLKLEVPKDDKRKGMVRLTWCIPHDVAEELRGKSAYLLIVAQAKGKPNDKRYQSRQLVQLNAGATFVSFRNSGENRVFAKIIIGDERHLRAYLHDHLTFLEDGGTEWALTSASIGEGLASRRARLVEIDAEIERASAAVQNDDVRSFSIEAMPANRVLIAYPNDDGSLSVGYCRRGEDRAFRGAFKRLPPGEALASFVGPHHALVTDATLPPEVLAQPASAKIDALRAERNQAEGEIAALEHMQLSIAADERMRGVTEPFDVPEEAFGDAWPPWLTHYLEFFPKRGPFTDECDRRKRLLFVGLTVQPFMMLVNFLLRVLIMLFAVALGCTKFPFRKVAPLITHDIGELTKDSWGAPFWFPAKEGQSLLRLLLIPFCPWFLAIATALVYYGEQGELSFFMALMLGMLGIYGVVAAFGALLGSIHLIYENWDAMKWFLNPLRIFTVFLFGGSPKIDDRDLETLVCDGDCADAKPKKRRKTLWLVLLGAKADACRPLQD